MPKNNDIMPAVLRDMRVKLAEMFDQNFREQGFFGAKWQPKKVYSKGGSPTILIVTGAMRRGIRAQVRGRGVVFTPTNPIRPCITRAACSGRTFRPTSAMCAGVAPACGHTPG